MKKERQHWPSWRYGPNGQSQVFDHEEQVPEGWVRHPSLLGNSTAADPTLRGNDSINRGQPQTMEQPTATTQGGETGQPTDDTPFKLPPEGDVQRNWIIGQLNARKVPHNPRWDKTKLYGLLYDALAPAQRR